MNRYDNVQNSSIPLHGSIQRVKEDLKGEDSSPYSPLRKSKRERFSSRKMIDMISVCGKRRHTEKNATCVSKTRSKQTRGRWTKYEQVAFLRGIKKFGKGKWSKIATAIPSRTTVQVKTHGQTMQKNLKSPEDVERMLRNIEGQEKDCGSSSTMDVTISESESDSSDSESESETRGFPPRALPSQRCIPSTRLLSSPVVLPISSFLPPEEPRQPRRQCNENARSLLSNDIIVGAQILVKMKDARGDCWERNGHGHTFKNTDYLKWNEHVQTYLSSS